MYIYIYSFYCCLLFYLLYLPGKYGFDFFFVRQNLLYRGLDFLFNIPPVVRLHCRSESSRHHGRAISVRTQEDHIVLLRPFGAHVLEHLRLVRWRPVTHCKARGRGVLVAQRHPLAADLPGNPVKEFHTGFTIPHMAPFAAIFNVQRSLKLLVDLLDFLVRDLPLSKANKQGTQLPISPANCRWSPRISPSLTSNRYAISTQLSKVLLPRSAFPELHSLEIMFCVLCPLLQKLAFYLLYPTWKRRNWFTKKLAEVLFMQKLLDHDCFLGLLYWGNNFSIFCISTKNREISFTTVQKFEHIFVGASSCCLCKSQSDIYKVKVMQEIIYTYYIYFVVLAASPRVSGNWGSSPKRWDKAFAIFFLPPKRWRSGTVPEPPLFHRILRFGSNRPWKYMIFASIIYIIYSRAVV